MGKGFLIVELRVGENFMPVANAKVIIKNKNGSTLYELTTEENGNTSKVTLDAPDASKSLYPGVDDESFAVYDVIVPSTNGYKEVEVHGVDVFEDQLSILPINMLPIIPGEGEEYNTIDIYIPPKHGVEMPKNQESPVETMQERQLPISDVFIPNYLTVHLGLPNAIANNTRVAFKDYIKNVASSEIFPTWPDASLRANIYAIISFALNRFNTVWYRSRGYDFDITSSTAVDQYFVPGRNIFENISDIVDGIFNMFIRRQGRREPFFAQFCNGTTSTCPGLSQWGTVTLAERGYNPIEILKYYYPDDIQIVESNHFANEIGVYGGVALREGTSGQEVQLMQRYLNRIAGNYPSIPLISNPNGFFDSTTTQAVRVFQQTFNLAADGIIGKKTWYQIISIYVAVRRLADLQSEGERIGIGASPPTSTIRVGSRGEDVVELQFLLNFISNFYPVVPFVIETGVFSEDTKRSVTEFQKNFGLTADGIVGPATWNKLYSVYHSLGEGSTSPAFPGTLLRVGSRGSNVQLMQNYLNAIARYYPSIPTITADGIFGINTENAVKAFQRQFGLNADGIIGRTTWNQIVKEYNQLTGGTPSRPAFPGTSLRVGSQGDAVKLMQTYLNAISRVYTSIPSITADGVFGSLTERSVKAFQSQFGLTSDGIIGPNTWDKIVSVYFYITYGEPFQASTEAINTDDESSDEYLSLRRPHPNRNRPHGIPHNRPHNPPHGIPHNRPHNPPHNRPHNPPHNRPHNPPHNRPHSPHIQPPTKWNPYYMFLMWVLFNNGKIY